MHCFNERKTLNYRTDANGTKLSTISTEFRQSRASVSLAVWVETSETLVLLSITTGSKPLNLVPFGSERFSRHFWIDNGLGQAGRLLYFLEARRVRVRCRKARGEGLGVRRVVLRSMLRLASRDCAFELRECRASSGSVLKRRSAAALQIYSYAPHL